MQTPYTSYEEMRESFTWDEAWDMVDGTPEDVNAAWECLDRHSGLAAQIKYADGSTSEHTYEELSSKSSQFANYLDDIGLTQDDRVAIMVDPGPEFLVAFFGTMKHGAAAVPCSELFGPDALEYRLVDSEASVLLTSSEMLETLDLETVDVTIEKQALGKTIAGYGVDYESDTSGEDDAWIQYTSGTTGRPTAVPYQHESVALFAPIMDFTLDFQPDDVCFTTSSTGWGTGIWIGTFAPLIHGITAGYYSGKFDPARVIYAVDELNVNILIGVVPTAYRKLVDQLEPGEVTVEKANYCGEPIDPELSKDVEDVLGAFPRSTYGVTEVRSIITIDYAFPDYEFRHGSMGKPVPGLGVTVVDEEENELPPGEVGYIAVDRAGRRIITSDAGYYDEDGYFWSAGRMDDTIITAGYTVGPQEVEDSLRSHPAVREAGVIGIPDKERGEVVKAFIEVDGSADQDLLDDVQQYVRETLSKHEYPKEIEVIDTVPTTPDGKIQREQLREYEGIAEE